MSQPVEDLRRAILGRYPLMYVVTWEEDRVVRLLQSFAAKVFQGQDPQASITTWSCVSGFGGALSAPEVTDPVVAIRTVHAKAAPGFYVLQDLPSHLDKPEVVRALREAYTALRGSGEKYIFITSPEINVPEFLKKELLVIEMELPDEVEIARVVKSFAQSYSQDLAPELLMELSFALKGLTLNEAGHTLHRIFRSKSFDRDQMLREIFRDKEIAVKKAGYLEFVPPQVGLDKIGGLENLKAWLDRRNKLFTRQAMEEGLPIPKGMLVMGMSGCGKSLAAKAVSHSWATPLFRLDMNLLNSGLFGTPEAAFHRALKTIEALKPAILWIDEIENSLGRDDNQSQGNAQIFSTFLTWMQEKPPMIFVAATANRIQALPAEVIRKGRFDQVFFVDLPTIEERKQIFKIHLERSGVPSEGFDLEILAIATKGWNGAEIEQAVAAARVDAYSEGRTFELADVTRNTSTTVPLSKTMHEQMKKIRSWAFGRATLASKEKYTEG